MCRNMSGMEMTAHSFMTIMSAFYFILQLAALLLLVKLCILSTDEGGKSLAEGTGRVSSYAIMNMVNKRDCPFDYAVVGGV